MDPTTQHMRNTWRAKMIHAEKVDSGITFQGGQGFGGSITAFPHKRLVGNAPIYTRAKFNPLIKNVPLGNKNNWATKLYA